MLTSSSAWVAIIDDDDSVRRSITRFLGTSGIRAEAFGSADEYMARPPGDLPDCLVLDAQLGPGMSAFELLDRMALEGIRLPVIFITGLVELQPALCGRYPELRFTLRKPFDPVALITRVRYHLRAAGGVAPAIDTPS
jgi:FixJ family two-component response regulator